jgi:ADP-ribose pyrophosphatase YjhB (NUDIX family)
MEIQSTLVNRHGQTLKVIYRDEDPLVNLEGKIFQSVASYCFFNEQLVVVYAESKGKWSIPGGHIEEGETYEEGAIREVLEETNMRVIKQRLLGYQDVYEPGGIARQIRLVSIVEPNGLFVSDSDGEITEIKLIKPEEHKDYLNWGKIGDHLMSRALKIKKEL